MLEMLDDKHKAHLIGWASNKKIPPASLECMSHTDLVLMLADDPHQVAYDIMERLLDKPIYLCARGETSLTYYDANNRPIVTPQGSYRGMPKLANSKEFQSFQYHIRQYKAKVDNRIVTEIQPNPKRAGSAAHERYKLYTIGKSVTWHLNNTDLTRPDFRFDIKQGFIVVITPGDVTPD